MAVIGKPVTLLFPISPENGIFWPFPVASQLKGKDQNHFPGIQYLDFLPLSLLSMGEDPGFGITLGLLQRLQGTEGTEYFTRQLSTVWNLPLIFTHMLDEFPYLSLIPDFKPRLVSIRSRLKLNTHFHILFIWEGRVESLRRDKKSSEFLFFLAKIHSTILEAAVPASPSCHQVQGGGDCCNVTEEILEIPVGTPRCWRGVREHGRHEKAFFFSFFAAGSFLLSTVQRQRGAGFWKGHAFHPCSGNQGDKRHPAAATWREGFGKQPPSSALSSRAQDPSLVCFSKEIIKDVD